MTPWFLIHVDGIGEPGHRHRPSDYTFQEFGWVEKALAAAQRISAARDQDLAYFSPFEGNPVYEVEFGWVRKNLEALLSWTRRSNYTAGYRSEPFEPTHLSVITQDFSAGLVLDHSCGYVEDDPNPDEVIYEVAIWGV